MNPVGLTRRQLDMLVFIKGYISEHGYSPTCREIADGAELASTSNIHRYILALEERGFLRRLPNRPRSLVLTEAGLAVAARFSARSVSREKSAKAAV